MRSLVDRVSSALLFCLFRNKKAILRGAPVRRGASPDRGEGEGLRAPDSCYLDGKNMQTALGLLCPQRGGVAAVYRGVMQFVVAYDEVPKPSASPTKGETLHQRLMLAPSSLPITRCRRDNTSQEHNLKIRQA